MVIIVSLITAAVFGSGDFCGGLAAKRASLMQVVAGSHAVGLVGVLLVALGTGSAPSSTAMALGAFGGLFGGIGVALLYRRLAVGPMHVVAPLTAITSAVVPTIWGTATGERLSFAAWIGLAVGLLAIGLVSSSGRNGSEAEVTVAVVLESLLAGTGFGLLFVVFDAADPTSAPWPVVGARLLTTVGLGALLVVGRVVGRGGAILPSGRPTWLLIGATGLLDTGANIGFLYATGRGTLAIVAVLTSLYPVATVVLAAVFLGERMSVGQRWGFVGAMVATGLIAAG